MYTSDLVSRAIKKGQLDAGLSDAVVVFLGRDRQHQNAESPSRERQRSRWKRNGPVGRPSSGGGSGRAWLSAAPIRNSRSMVISGWGVCRSFPAVTALVPDQGSSPIPGWR